MKLGIMQPYFFPYLGYWQLLNYVDTYVVYDDVNFIKGGWINRNYILSNGNRLLLTLNLKKASPNKRINEIEIGNNQNKILKTIFQSYSKAPYFNSVYPLIEEIFSTSEQNLALFLINSIQKIVDFLEIRTQVLLSSGIGKNNALKGQDKVLALCKKVNASNYINPVGGQELYSKEEFLKHGINLFFLKSEKIVYRQFDSEFVAGLSIIDVMMFNPIKNIQDYLNMYKLN